MGCVYKKQNGRIYLNSNPTMPDGFGDKPSHSIRCVYDNTRGAWLTQEGCTLTERKEVCIAPI